MRYYLHHILRLFCLSTLLLTGCNSSNSEKHIAGLPKLIRDTTIKYAKRFAICRTDSFTVIYLFANRNITDTTHRFVLSKNRTPQPVKSDAVIVTPCRRIASLSSIYSNMIAELGGAENIVAVENIDYYNREDILTRYRKGLVSELQRSSDLNREKAIQLNPDVMFSFGMGNSNKEKEDKISQSGIPFVICLDHLEETPLARAEWIRFFGCFLDREKEAATYFSAVETNYNIIKKKAAENTSKPTVFSELKFGDTWYVPAGKSYMARLLEDAGANYLWSQDTTSGSLPLSFETVYRKAKEADYWINVSMCKSLKEMLDQDKRYADFEAFRKKQVFNNTRRINEKGYTSYWESGITSPQVILNDLFLIFNSVNMTDSIETKLYYYTRLN